MAKQYVFESNNVKVSGGWVRLPDTDPPEFAFALNQRNEITGGELMLGFNEAEFSEYITVLVELRASLEATG